MKRVLLLLPTTSYRNREFLAAAQALGVEIVAAANYCHQLAPAWGMAPIMALHFDRPQRAADTVAREISAPPDAVLAVDDAGLELAALLSARFGLAGNPAQAVRSAARQARVSHAYSGSTACPARGFITCRATRIRPRSFHVSAIRSS